VVQTACVVRSTVDRRRCTGLSPPDLFCPLHGPLSIRRAPATESRRACATDRDVASSSRLRAWRHPVDPTARAEASPFCPCCIEVRVATSGAAVDQTSLCEGPKSPTRRPRIFRIARSCQACPLASHGGPWGLSEMATSVADVTVIALPHADAGDRAVIGLTSLKTGRWRCPARRQRSEPSRRSTVCRPGAALGQIGGVPIRVVSDRVHLHRSPDVEPGLGGGRGYGDLG